MTRARNHGKGLLAVGAVLAIAIAVIALKSSGNENVGTLSVSAVLAGGEPVGELAYTVSGNGIAPVTGSVGISDSRTAVAFTVVDLPPGSGFLLDVAAASGDLKIKCSRREKFDVAAAKTTSVKVVLLCRGPTRAPVQGFKKVPAIRSAAGSIAATPPVPEACITCEKEYIASGECEPDSGCDGLKGEDRQLCENLLNCMRATNCWIDDPGDCLCGTAKDLDCTTEKANGDCRAEIQAATRSTDPIKNGTLFFDPTVPAGRATRLISCDKEKCLNHCAQR
jgi:hypothetical protein